MRSVSLDLFDEERRRCKRVAFSASAFVLPAGARRALSATVENISVGGLGVRAPYSVPIGKAVNVLIELEGQPFDTTAIVVRGNPMSGYGLRFINVEPEGMQFISRLIAALSGKAGEKIARGTTDPQPGGRPNRSFPSDRGTRVER